jgi:hypothetical protein
MISHTLYPDLFLLNWLTASGFAFDLYHDGDLFSRPIPNTGPTQWSRTSPPTCRMAAFSSAPAATLSTSESASPGDGNSLIFRVPATGARDTFGSQTPPRPEAEIVGANLDGRQPPFMTFAPCQGRPGQPSILRRDRASNGSTFGAAAYNGAASGWEVNTPLNPSFAQLAHGLNQGGGAVMAYATHPGGDWVFSVNSISFNSTLPEDSASSTILKNVLTHAISWAARYCG